MAATVARPRCDSHEPAPDVDLHLLACFEALMRERHVSRAAESMSLGQSSMSEALGRLRLLFGDPLLVRSRDGMAPTPRALELQPQVRELLERSQALLDRSSDFDPAQARHVFRLVASDYTQFILLPRLLSELAERAPQSAIDVVPINVRALETALESGEADLAVGLVPEPPPGLRRRVLFGERSVCIARRDHPAFTTRLTAAGFAGLPHIHVAPSGLRFFSAALDEALQREGLTRRVVLTSPQFLLAAHVVAGSDAVVMLPSRVARRLEAVLPVSVFEPPLDLPSYEIAMLWHERTHSSRAHAWLRELVTEVLPRGTGA
jgi:DNA-binding transcriptional LysR family regulator